MTKANTRRRIVSVLLALVMLVSLMPSLVVPAHAFWDDYDTGGDCPNCDHYHWAENLCDCQFCTMPPTMNMTPKACARSAAMYTRGTPCRRIISAPCAAPVRSISSRSRKERFSP